MRLAAARGPDRAGIEVIAGRSRCVHKNRGVLIVDVILRVSAGCGRAAGQERVGVRRDLIGRQGDLFSPTRLSQNETIAKVNWQSSTETVFRSQI